MRNIHAFTLMRRTQEWTSRLLRAFACVRKQRVERKAGRESISSVNAHLRRDIGLDKIPDDR